MPEETVAESMEHMREEVRRARAMIGAIHAELRTLEERLGWKEPPPPPWPRPKPAEDPDARRRAEAKQAAARRARIRQEEERQARLARTAALNGRAAG